MLLALVMVVGFAAILVSRAWWVYSLLDTELGMAMSRSSFIWGMFAGKDLLRTAWTLIFPFTLFSVAGSCVALWQVRRRTRA